MLKNAIIGVLTIALTIAVYGWVSLAKDTKELIALYDENDRLKGEIADIVATQVARATRIPTQTYQVTYAFSIAPGGYVVEWQSINGLVITDMSETKTGGSIPSVLHSGETARITVKPFGEATDEHIVLCAIDVNGESATKVMKVAAQLPTGEPLAVVCMVTLP